jgi:hypothetical protein
VGVTELVVKCVCERIRITNLVGTLDESDLRWLGTLFRGAVLTNTMTSASVSASTPSALTRSVWSTPPI